MTIADIIKARKCGVISVTFSNESIFPEHNHYPMFGLKGSFEWLQEISLTRARNVLRALLLKDLAYHGECMPLDEAQKITNFLLKAFSEESCSCYTNGAWDKYHNSKTGFSWNGMTEATFDGGIIVSSPGLSLCVWVEDED